jgi:hypothetical protein
MQSFLLDSAHFRIPAFLQECSTMEENEDTDLLLWLTEVFTKYENDLRAARREVHRLLLNEAWRIAMRSRHYLTADCLDTPCESAWMSVYLYGSDTSFLNVTSLTRKARGVRVWCTCVVDVI